MRILQLHTNFIEFTPIDKEVVEAEESDRKRRRFKDIIVLFTAVEEGDSEQIAQRAITDVKSFLEKIGGNRVLIYPYAHLSNNLADPGSALKIIEKMEKKAKEKGINVYRAPFGWNKQFSISIKPYPLSEQLRTYVSKGEKEMISEALKAEERLESEWFIMNLKGKLIPIDKFDFSNNLNLKKFSIYEMSKSRAVTRVSPHIPLMKRLEIADNEPGSDIGNLRYYPKGRLIKSLLEQYVTKKVIEYGGMEVETPIMYDINHPSLASYLNRFPARQYIIKSKNRNFFLRFSACFGQFLMTHDAQISYKQLPFKIYELTKYSFRREKSGELVGLRRLRAFTMPDVHAICCNLDQALKEAVVRFKLCMRILKEGLEISNQECELAIRFTKKFFEENKEFVIGLVKLFGKPALIEVWPQRFFYFILKWEYNFIDNLDKASALSTDQIDVENAERYGITYIDESGEKKYPIILHCSPSGAIERCIYTLLEKAYTEMSHKQVPKLPLWLSPTQVRLILISDKYLLECTELAKNLRKTRIRVDIDDRELTVSNKVRQAEQEWIPYIICFGEKEVESKMLAVRKRELNSIELMSVDTLIREVKEKVGEKPFKQLSLPMLLSRRPIFIG